jgi:hypothetical protein
LHKTRGSKKDDRRIRLRDVAGKGSRFTYVYDFGDDWRHSIRVEEVLASDPTVKVPRCTGGARAAPPEDSGGPLAATNEALWSCRTETLTRRAATRDQAARRRLS